MIKNSLRKKLGLYIFLTIFVFGLSATSFAFFYSRDVFQEKESSSLVTSVVEQSHEIERIFLGSEVLARKISEQEAIVNFLEKEGKEGVDLVGCNLNSYNISEAYSAIYLLDDSGNTLISTDDSFTGNNYSFRDYFKKIGQDGLDNYIDISIGVTDGELGYYISNSVKKDGVLLGVVVLKLKPEIVNDTIHLLNRGFNYLSIIDDYGVVVFSTKEELLYKSIIKLSDIDFDVIDKKRRFPNINITSLDYGILRADLSDISNSDVFDVIDSDGEDSILIVGRISNLPFFVVIEEKNKDVQVGILSFSYDLALFVFFAAFFAAVIIFYIIRYFLSPVISLNNIFKKVADGDLSQRSVVKSKDEFGEMGSNLNKIVSSLQNCLKNTEKEVDSRTKQLEEVNSIMVGRELKMVELKKELMEYKNKQNENKN